MKHNAHAMMDPDCVHCPFCVSTTMASGAFEWLEAGLRSQAETAAVNDTQPEAEPHNIKNIDFTSTQVPGTIYADGLVFFGDDDINSNKHSDNSHSVPAEVNEHVYGASLGRHASSGCMHARQTCEQHAHQCLSSGPVWYGSCHCQRNHHAHHCLSSGPV